MKYFAFLLLCACMEINPAPPMAGKCEDLTNTHYDYNSIDMKRCIWRNKIWLCSAHIYSRSQDWECTYQEDVPPELRISDNGK